MLESNVPWASFERTISTFRVIIKVVISVGLVFDKAGKYRGQVNLVCFFFQAFIVFKRYTTAIIFKSSIYYAFIIYESLSMWLYLTISLHILTDSGLSLFSLI